MAREIPFDDREFIRDGRKFIAAAMLNPSAYGTTLARLTAFGLLLDALEAAQDDEDLKETAFRAALQNTKAKRAPAEADFRAERNDAYEHATDEELIEADLDPHKKPVKSNPTPPRNLKVVGGSDGINRLSYEAGENGAGTEYVLYARDSPSEAWKMFDIVSTLKGEDEGQIVGKLRYYQVRARRRKILSDPSNVAIAWGN